MIFDIKRWKQWRKSKPSEKETSKVYNSLKENPVLLSRLNGGRLI